MENSLEFLERLGALIMFCLAVGLLFIEISGLDRIAASEVVGRMFRIITIMGGTV